jgi:hypothetical protein
MSIRRVPHHWSRLYTLNPNRPVSLRLPDGALVRGLSGTIWLTQEGHHQDVVLQPGDGFETTQHGLVVMNGVDDVAMVYVEASQDEASRRLLIPPGLVAHFEARARRVRNQEIARLLRRAGEWILRMASALKMRLT